MADAQRLAPELAVIQANQAIFLKLAKYPDPAKIPPALVKQAIIAAGGGSTPADMKKGAAILQTIAANQAAITGVIAVAPDLQKLAPYAAQLAALQQVAPDLLKLQGYKTELTALSKVPKRVIAYAQANSAAFAANKAKTVGQWKTWYWICAGGIVLFLLSIPILRGRWLPAAARRDEAEHEAMVDAEMTALAAA